ncbi:MAG: oxygenase MpaB family protein [Gordonia sp. (in: high G+C Gram-positive bacteria)]|uniref:oxygenase MpaB family protein n=1 Tax=Gordonia sp. (in: high G+C Gram-positive bacteria) TaxID=84139 RepID=UPI003C71390E
MTAEAIDPAAAERHSRRQELDDQRVDDLGMLGIALLAGPANVIMQLAVPAVGYGVFESKVASGNLFKVPIKRTRTTLSYLAVAAMGSAEDRRRYRQAVNRAHVQVRSNDDSPVKYNAFDPKLQLWVAACLYRGWEDMERLYGDPANITEAAYRQGAVMGTTLQMPPEMWPPTRADFETYWNQTVADLEIDDTIRDYLLRIVRMDFLPRPVSLATGWFSETMTIGFLPEEFRQKMGVHLTPFQERFFDVHNALVRRVVRVLPRPLKTFPFNLLLADVRRRMRTGRPLV